MSTPVDPRRSAEPSQSAAGSLPSGVDDTIASPTIDPAAPAFGPPVERGEVGYLGPYRVVKELGRGGMGAVYAALDTRLERRLALKVMLPQFAADSEAKERFLREARAAARIKHDNVVTVYEADERDGIPYIAMEFLEGYPLDEYLKKKGSPTIMQIMRIGAETAAGLAAAHKIGLVHRDIKPGNLWLEAPSGRVKVLDFGLAKPVDAAVELTKMGAIVGTPAYMSPEQAGAKKVDHRTDLFSLGAVLYRLCAGQLPFQGPTTMALLMALGTEEPAPVRSLNPAVPESLAALIHQLLAKKAGDRPQTAEEVVKRLRSIAQEVACPSTTQPQVVYVPMPITAAPEANPFADIDLQTEMSPSASGEHLKPATNPIPMKVGRTKPWLLAGLVALLAVGAGITIINRKSGTGTKPEVPDVSTAMVRDKDGKTITKIGANSRPPIAPTDPDRKAAEWVLSIGGEVGVNGGLGYTRNAAELPKERFTLVFVNFDNTAVTNADLANLKGLKGVEIIYFCNTKVTDAGLIHLNEIESLKFLHLHGTVVTVSGLAQLKNLGRLNRLILEGHSIKDGGLDQLKAFRGSLELANTPLTDEGLTQLQACKGLSQLDVRGTKVTPKGIAEFHATVPGCAITHDGGVIEAIDIDRKAAEWVLSVGGEVDVNEAGLWLKAAAELPKDRITLNAVKLTGKPVTDADLANLKSLAKLKTLYLSSQNVTDAGLTNLKELKALTWLDVRGAKVTTKGLDAFHAAIPGCRIEHVGGIIQPKGVADRTAAEWVFAIGGAVGVDQQGVELRNGSQLPQRPFELTQVNLGGNQKVTDDNLAALKDCTALRVVFLGGTKITDAGLVHLSGCTNLFALHLPGTKIGDAGVANFANCSRLTSLDLSQTAVSDAGLAAFKSCKGLNNLTLRECAKISEQGLANFKNCTELYSIDLDRTPITDEGLKHFLQCKGLNTLSVRKTRVSAAGLKEFHAAVPGCKIEHDGGVIEAKK